MLSRLLLTRVSSICRCSSHIQPAISVSSYSSYPSPTRRFSQLLQQQQQRSSQWIAQVSSFHLTSSTEKKSKWPFHVTMTDDEKKKKEDHIKQMKEEEVPKTLIAKVKYYFKRYWYIAVPAHAVSCTAYFVMFYAMVKSGVDVVALLEFLHMPDALIEKIKTTPESAGVFVIALILYKIALPIRYATTLVLIQAAFWTLRRMGKLKTAREVEYKVRTEYEKNKIHYGRKLYRNRNLGVRDVLKKETLIKEEIKKVENMLKNDTSKIAPQPPQKKE